MNQDNPYAAPQAAVADVIERDAAPALWNPGAAASWSLLFTPIFGTILHMKNWQALGEPEKADSSRKWAIANVVFILAVLAAAVTMPESKPVDALSRLGGLAMLVTWYFSSGKAQMAFVDQRFGKNYPKRGWGKPLLFGLLGMVGLFVVAAVFGILYVLVTGQA